LFTLGLCLACKQARVSVKAKYVNSVFARKVAGVVSKLAKRVVLFVALAFALASAGMFVPRPVWRSAAAHDAGVDQKFLIVSNPIHTGIAIPANDETRAQFTFLRNAGLEIDNPAVGYVIVGWGGRAFYTQTPSWADLKPIPVVKSFTIDTSVMHVELAGDIDENDPDVTVFTTDQAGAARLMQFILQSFDGGPDNPISLPDYAYGPYDAFFEAKGYFNILLGCNTWTAAALRQAGVKTGWWTPLPWMLRLSLRLHNGSGVFD
jgi:uncharacterized protein (TIGR02117 family)